jgi:RHS repeat-associated protein
LMPSLRIHDILGNRTGRNYTSYYNASVRLYKWDDVNRLLATAGLSGSSGARYVYRADGMRIEKVTEITLQWVENPSEDDGSGFYDEITATNKPTTRYFYDGQMCVEDDDLIQIGSSWEEDITVRRYGIGARGIDFIGYTENEQSEVQNFPIYDGHGNMVATIRRDGTGFVCENRRALDAWGEMRQGTAGQDPRQQYCANLGHSRDNESGLTYMRARYYEPWTGRFVSEDPGRDGENWFSYCGSDPVNGTDFTGENYIKENSMTIAWAVYFFYQFAKNAFNDGTSAGQVALFLGFLAGGVAITQLEKRGDWVERVAKKVYAWYRLGWIKNPDNVVFKMSKNSVIVSFYMGYSIGLVAIAEMLEDEIMNL